MAERARKLRLKLKKEKEEQKVDEHKEETSVNVDEKESKQNKGKIIFKKIELSSDDDNDDKDSDDSSYYEPPVRGKNNVVQRSKTPILRKSQKLSKEMHIDNNNDDEIEPLTFLNNLNENNNNEYQLPQVDFGFDLDKLISGNINNNEEHSVMNSSLNNSHINQDTSIHEMPSMKVNLMDIMQARINLKKINNVRNSRKIKSSLKQANTNKEDDDNIMKLRKLSPSKTKVSKLLIEKEWNKNLNEMINQKVEEVKLLPGFNLNNKISDILNKRKGRSKYFFENDPDVKVIKGDSNEFKRKVYNVDLVSIMKQTVKS